MHESLLLFAEIFGSKYFRNSEIFLILNKHDIFCQALLHTPLSICFSEKNDWFGEQWTGLNYNDYIDYNDYLQNIKEPKTSIASQLEKQSERQLQKTKDISNHSTEFAELVDEQTNGQVAHNDAIIQLDNNNNKANCKEENGVTKNSVTTFNTSLLDPSVRGDSDNCIINGRFETLTLVTENDRDAGVDGKAAKVISSGGYDDDRQSYTLCDYNYNYNSQNINIAPGDYKIKSEHLLKDKLFLECHKEALTFIKRQYELIVQDYNERLVDHSPKRLHTLILDATDVNAVEKVCFILCSFNL